MVNFTATDDKSCHYRRGIFTLLTEQGETPYETSKNIQMKPAFTPLSHGIIQSTETLQS